MQLSLRLSAIANMVTEGNRLVDVGCDHGYLPVYLIETHRIPGAIAADVGKGPLARAKEHILQYGLEKYIETRLSDGLKEIRQGEGDTLVIAGMGGPLMEKILTEGKEVLGGFRELLLQPQSDIGHVRQFLLQNHWRIVVEDSVLEDGKYYFIMKAVPGRQEPEWNKEEKEFGGLLLEMRHPVLEAYLKRELRIRNEILDRLKDVHGEAAIERKQEVMEERRLILAALKRYEG